MNNMIDHSAIIKSMEMILRTILIKHFILYHTWVVDIIKKNKGNWETEIERKREKITGRILSCTHYHYYYYVHYRYRLSLLPSLASSLLLIVIFTIIIIIIITNLPFDWARLIGIQWPSLYWCCCLIRI